MREFFIADLEEIFALVRKAKCAPEQLPDTIARLYGELMEACPTVELTGAPRIYYLTWTESESEIMAALPVEAGTYPVDTMTFAACKALNTTHVGLYEGLAKAWADMWAEIAAKGMIPTGAPYDDYVVEASQEPDSAKWVTELYVPLKL